MKLVFRFMAPLDLDTKRNNMQTTCKSDSSTQLPQFYDVQAQLLVFALHNFNAFAP